MTVLEDADQIIEELQDIEKKVLLVLAKERISSNNNIRQETILKKLPDKDIQKGKKAINNLVKKGIIRKYRHKNYALDKIGVIIANKLKKSYQDESYKDIHILFMIT